MVKLKSGYESRIEQIGNIYQQLLQSEKIYFAILKPSMLEKDLAVVYAIYDKNSDQALYVGRSKNLRRRLYTNHLQGNKSTARLKKYIVEDVIRHPTITTYEQAKDWIKDNCYFKYIVVNDTNERGHTEGLLGYILKSVYIEDEH